MSLHVQMSPQAVAALRRAAWFNKLSALTASMVCLVLGGGILFGTAVYIAMEQEAEFITYVSPVEDAPPRAVPTTAKLSAKAAAPSASVAPSVIVAAAAAPVAMAQVEVPVGDDFGDGIGIDLGMGMEVGLGDGLGEGGEGLGSSQVGGSALEGTFYDLKQTKNGAPNANAEGGRVNKDAVIAVLNDFIKTWNPAALNKFYQSPTKLYASHFCIPACNANYAPYAYQCQDKVKPAGWVAVYRGRVRAPKSGTFRFVGTGDEVIIVRFNRDIVLEAGYALPGLGKTYTETHVAGKNRGTADFRRFEAGIQNGTDRVHKGYEFFPHPDTPLWNAELGGLMAGKEFRVTEGQVYPVEVLISEVPGGAFGMALFIQETTHGKSKDYKTLQLFRTNFAEPNSAELKKLIGSYADRGEIKVPQYDTGGLIWPAVP